MIDKQNKDIAVSKLLEAFNDDKEEAIAYLMRRPLNEVQPKKKVNIPANTNPVIIKIEDVSKQYKLGKQKVQALNNVTLEIREGDFVALTGPSGSGKSTLLQLMGGLDKPSQGNVVVADNNLAKLGDRKLSNFRGQTIGFVFQFFYLQPFLSLQTNLEVPGMFARTKHKKRSETAAELAKKVGLEERLKHRPKELSGGQMQRAAIARALLNNPKVILADEPTGNLDSANGQAIIDLFEKVRQDFGTTIIIVTHDPSIAKRADYQIKLSDGKISGEDK